MNATPSFQVPILSHCKRRTCYVVCHVFNIGFILVYSSIKAECASPTAELPFSFEVSQVVSFRVCHASYSSYFLTCLLHEYSSLLYRPLEWDGMWCDGIRSSAWHIRESSSFSSYLIWNSNSLIWISRGYPPGGEVEALRSLSWPSWAVQRLHGNDMDRQCRSHTNLVNAWRFEE